MRPAFVLGVVVFASCGSEPVAPALGLQSARLMRFSATTKPEAMRWQKNCRRRLFALLMGGAEPERGPVVAQTVRRIDVPYAEYHLEEITIQSLPDRRAHLWVAAPNRPAGRSPVVLAIHGHGGTGEQIVRGQSLYWYGKALAEMGYVVIAPDVGQHELQHKTWTLMGERTWDCIRALDYAATRPDVDAGRMAVCGLSLGGETTMYVAALDPRIKAVDSSGWLTTVANMRNGHCPCYDFPGLAENFDFADIFGCIAPRPLVCEIGEQERAPGGFPVDIARGAFAEVRRVYAVTGAEDNAVLTIHPGGHVFVGYDFWEPLRKSLGAPSPWLRSGNDAEECRRRGQIAARCLNRAVGVLNGWMATRDARFGMVPRRTNESVWAPSDNAADMLPFLFTTEYFTGTGRRDDLLRMLEAEERLTSRAGVLPDWFSLETGGWLHPTVDPKRLMFCAAEYCKDGLMPMTEAMGVGPWTTRMLGLLDAMVEQAAVETRFGRIPADDTEVNGDLLQVLGRAHAMTGQRRYLDLMLRIADAYCLEVLPASAGIPYYRWDFATHRPLSDAFVLNDHGNEIVLGLAEAYIAARTHDRAKADAYLPALQRMFWALLKHARGADGMWVNRVQPSTLRVADPATPDTWGYALCGLVAFADAAGDAELLGEGRRLLNWLSQPRSVYWSGADSYADSIEGAVLLRHRFDDPAIDRWIDRALPAFLACQQPSGIVEGWYGDGNYARTALMVALRYSEGARCLPWRQALECGAVRRGSGLRLQIRSPEAWSGRLVFDTPRSRDVLRLPIDYPRLNSWPEWFTVEGNATYTIKVSGRAPRRLSGAALADGLPLSVRPGRTVVVDVAPVVVAEQ